MTVRFRPIEPRDFDALRALYAATGATWAATRTDELLAWLLRHPEAPAGSVVGEADGKLVAHLGAIPCTFTLEGEAFSGLHTAEWISDPRAGGAGVALMAKLVRTRDVAIVIGGSDATRSLLPGLGFRTAGPVEVFFRPMRPIRCALSLPAPLPVRLARIPRYIARRLLRARTATVEPVAVPIDRLPVVTPVPAGAVANSISRAHAGWLAACPSTECQAVVPAGDDPSRGFGLALVDRSLPRAPRGVIAHVACADGSPAAWLRLAAAVDRHLALLGCVSATTLASHPPLVAAFRALGYASHAVPLFVRDRTGRLADRTWHVTPADGDHAYRMF